MASHPHSSHSEEIASVYDLLARLWQSELDATLLEKLRDGELKDAFVAVGGLLPAGDSEQIVEDLALDFCQLFIGPKQHLPPYQSVWQTGQFEGAPAASMRRYASLLPSDQANEEIDDHFATILATMGGFVNALKARVGDADEILDVIRAFFRDHLTWAGQLCQAVAQRGNTEFYRSVARLTDAFLHQESLVWNAESPNEE